MPVLSLFIDNKRALEYAIGVGFLVNVAAPFVVGLLGLNWNTALNIGVVSSYLLYVLAGYWLANNELPKWARLTIYGLAFGLTAYRFVGTVIASYDAGSLVKVGWGYNSVPDFFESLAVFILVKRAMSGRDLSERTVAVLSKMSACSFGIYLVHSIVIWHMQILTGLNGLSNLWRLGGPVVVYLVCLVLVYLGRGTKKLRWLFP